jgi:hypothetical protein
MKINSKDFHVREGPGSSSSDDLRRKTASGASLASWKPSPYWASFSSAAKLAGVNSRSNGSPGRTVCVKVASHKKQELRRRSYAVCRFS